MRGFVDTRQPLSFPQRVSYPKLEITFFGSAKLPLPVANETITPSFQKPTTSAIPSPLTSAIVRMCLSTRQLSADPSADPNPETAMCGGANLPPPVANETITPSRPKPTTSAIPSPLTSAIMRGVEEPSSQPQPSLNSKTEIAICGGAKVPLRLANATITPSSPKPTTSAIPSPLTSDITRM